MFLNRKRPNESGKQSAMQTLHTKNMRVTTISAFFLKLTKNIFYKSFF